MQCIRYFDLLDEWTVNEITLRFISSAVYDDNGHQMLSCLRQVKPLRDATLRLARLDIGQTHLRVLFALGVRSLWSELVEACLSNDRREREWFDAYSLDLSYLVPRQIYAQRRAGSRSEGEVIILGTVAGMSKLDTLLRSYERCREAFTRIIAAITRLTEAKLTMWSAPSDELHQLLMARLPMQAAPSPASVSVQVAAVTDTRMRWTTRQLLLMGAPDLRKDNMLYLAARNGCAQAAFALAQERVVMRPRSHANPYDLIINREALYVAMTGRYGGFGGDLGPIYDSTFSLANEDTIIALISANAQASWKWIDSRAVSNLAGNASEKAIEAYLATLPKTWSTSRFVCGSMRGSMCESVLSPISNYCLILREAIQRHRPSVIQLLFDWRDSLPDESKRVVDRQLDAGSLNPETFPVSGRSLNPFPLIPETLITAIRCLAEAENEKREEAVRVLSMLMSHTRASIPASESAWCMPVLKKAVEEGSELAVRTLLNDWRVYVSLVRSHCLPILLKVVLRPCLRCDLTPMQRIDRVCQRPDSIEPPPPNFVARGPFYRVALALLESSFTTRFDAAEGGLSEAERWRCKRNDSDEHLLIVAQALANAQVDALPLHSLDGFLPLCSTVIDLMPRLRQRNRSQYLIERMQAKMVAVNRRLSSPPPAPSPSPPPAPSISPAPDPLDRASPLRSGLRRLDRPCPIADYDDGSDGSDGSDDEWRIDREY